MKKIISGSQPMDYWHSIIKEAQANSHIQLNDEIEHYIIITLNNYLTQTDLGSNNLAITFLENVQNPDPDKLRKIGDQCLIISGLFPEFTYKKNVSLVYFIDIGKEAYFKISTLDNKNIQSKLYYTLSQDFMGLVDVIYHIKPKLPIIKPE